MSLRSFFLTLFGIGSSAAAAADPPALLTAGDLASFENPPADVRIHYGDDPLQFGELRLPVGDGPHPVMVFLHGGCWYAEFDITHSNKLTAAFARNGIATWSLEYRRIGNEGGAWPGTFEDASRGADHLRVIADQYNLDLSRVIVAGHSAGGQLALWLAARPGFGNDAPVRSASPVSLKGVLGLAPAADFKWLHREGTCGDAVDKLMGGAPDAYPERYRWADPMQLPASGVTTTVVVGKYDDAWAPAGRSYTNFAGKRGDRVKLITAEQAGHFELIDPDSSTFELVLQRARELLE